MTTAAKDAAPEGRRQDRPNNFETFITWRDALMTFMLPGLAVTSWLLPPSRWGALARFVARVMPGVFVSRVDLRAERIARKLGLNEAKVERDLRALAGERLIWLMEILRMNRPGAQPPPITVEGAEGPKAALAEGRGAILWWCPSAHRDLAPKIGLAQEGLDIVHLTRPGHGLSASVFGRRYLNRLLVRIEERYLKDRAVIDLDAPAGATLKLRKELKANGVVGVAAAASRHKGASKAFRAPFFQGRFPFAPGAATLAEKSKAGLFPVVTIREGGAYRIVVGPDISENAKKHRRMIRHFARFNQREMSRAPGQWAGWLQI